MKLNISVLEYFGLVLAMMLYRTSEGELKSCTDLLLLLTEERQKASWLDTWQTGISRTSLVSIYTSASVLSVRLVWALNTLEKTTAFAFHWGPCVAEGQTNEPWALYFIADERSEYWRYNCTTFWVFFFWLCTAQFLFISTLKVIGLVHDDLLHGTSLWYTAVIASLKLCRFKM